MQIQNKKNKPKNILYKEQSLLDEISSLQSEFPAFLNDYFLYMKTYVATSTRIAYLHDLKFFFNYLLIGNNQFNNIKEITIDIIDCFTAKDFNFFISEYSTRYEVIRNDERIIYENSNVSLARKRSSIITMLKFLYRNGQISNNISDAINPIKTHKKTPDNIKKLNIDEAENLIKIVSTGEGLSQKELVYWKQTKKRDLLIILFFVIYGLRVSELEALNISSFNFARNEYKIYRKRGKEVDMPLDNKLKELLIDYIETERNNISNISDEDALFLSTHGGRLIKRSIQNLVKKYTSIVLGSSKNNGFSPHKLRATAASSMIEKGFSIYDVQLLLDHDNVTTTQLYSSHKKNARKEIIDNLDWIK